MTTPEFKINEIVEDTESYGTVQVMDIFRSITNQDWLCYRVETTGPDRASFLATEEELLNLEDV